MKKNIVSIIIPVYNTERYLEKCVESVINQSYKAIEIYLIDDGSTDKSAIICDRFAREKRNIHVMHNRNLGIGAARNCGLDNICGDFIMFLDSDDYLEYNIIEILVNKAHETGADIVAAGFEQNNDMGKRVGIMLPNKEEKYTGINALKKHYQDKLEGVSIVYVWGRLYKKNIFDSIRFKENIKYEDIHLMPQIMLKTQLMVYLPIIGYHYVIHDESVSHNKNNYESLYIDSFKIWEEQLAFYKENKKEEFEKYISFLICEKIMSHDTKNSIPANYKEYSKLQFKKNFLKAITSRISIKRKMRVVLYKLWNVCD